MTVFRSLMDAIKEGYEVVSSTPDGYNVRLTQGDGTQKVAFVLLLRDETRQKRIR